MFVFVCLFFASVCMLIQAYLPTLLCSPLPSVFFLPGMAVLAVQPHFGCKWKQGGKVCLCVFVLCEASRLSLPAQLLGGRWKVTFRASEIITAAMTCELHPHVYLAHPTSALSHIKRRFRGRAIVPVERGRAMRKGAAEVVLFVCKVLFSCRSPLCWTKGLEEGDNVTGPSWGKVIYCCLSADSTGQYTWSPTTPRRCH